MTAAEEPVDAPVDAPVDPDEVAEEAPIDPTPQEVDEYRALIGDEVPESDEAPESDEVAPVERAGPGREAAEPGEG